MSRHDSTPLRAYAVIVLAIVATSSAAILIRFALAEDMPPLLIAGSRLAVATVALTPLALGKHRQRIANLSRREVALVAVSGLCLAAHFTAWVSSLQYTTVLVSVVIVSTGPIWVAIMEVVFLHIRLSRLVVAGLLVALAGGALIGIPLDGGAALPDAELQATITGAILAWLGALSVSVYMLIGRVLRAQLPVIPYVWLVYGTASIAAAIVMLFSGTPLLGFRIEGYLILLTMGLVPPAAGAFVLELLAGIFPGRAG